MKKSITAMLMFLAMLLGSCSGGGDGEIRDSGTSAPSDTETEFSAEAESEPAIPIDEALAGYTVYETTLAANDRGVNPYDLFFRGVLEKWESGEAPPEYYAVKFSDAPALALVIRNSSDGTDRNVCISRVYHGGKWSDCDIALYANQFTEIRDMGDFVYIEEVGADQPTGVWFFHGGEAEFFAMPKDGKIYFFREEDDKLVFYAESSQYFARTDTRAENYTSDDDFYYSEGVVTLRDGKIAIEETKSYTIAEWYMTDHAASVRKSDGCATWEEFKTKYLNKG